MSALSDGFTALGSIATAVAVGVAAWQLRHAQKQALTDFEDQLSKQYREIIRDLPVEAVLGEELDDAHFNNSLGAFYHYFDLSNEQAFLYSRGRISKETWDDWREGINQHFQRKAFRRAWREIRTRSPESFDELRKVVDSQ